MSEPPVSSPQNPPPREAVNGIGGVFIYANEPLKLVSWYREHLGIKAANQYEDTYYEMFTYQDLNGHKKTTTWAIFPAKDQPVPPGRAFMINYHVANLDRLLDQLRAAGVAIEKVEDYDYGRFAWITDPEGHRIELFEERAAHLDYVEADG